MLVWLTLPFYDFCGFRSVAVNSVYKLQFFTFIIIPSPFDIISKGFVFLDCLSVPLSRQVLLPRYFMNGLSNLNEIYTDYSLASADDLIRFWRSKVKVTAGCRGGADIRVNPGASKSIF